MVPSCHWSARAPFQLDETWGYTRSFRTPRRNDQTRIPETTPCARSRSPLVSLWPSSCPLGPPHSPLPLLPHPPRRLPPRAPATPTGNFDNGRVLAYTCQGATASPATRTPTPATGCRRSAARPSSTWPRPDRVPPGQAPASDDAGAVDEFQRTGDRRSLCLPVHRQVRPAHVESRASDASRHRPVRCPAAGRLFAVAGGEQRNPLPTRAMPAANTVLRPPPACRRIASRR